MNYRVELSRAAQAYLRRIDTPSQLRIGRRVEQIAAEPRGVHSKPLAGPGSYHAARVGPWRIIFRIDDEEQIVLVTDIGPRGQIYRGL